MFQPESLELQIASPAAAATLLFVIAFCVAGLAMVFTTGASPLALVLQQPKYLLPGSVLLTQWG
jgi:uncharacterized membrane protein